VERHRPVELMADRWKIGADALARKWWKEADRCVRCQEKFDIKINIVFSLGLQLNSKQIPKNLGKFLEDGNQVWNNFHYCNFFQIFTDFELIKRFWVKADLTGLSSYRLIATLIANPPDLLLEQEVIHSDVQTLHYDLGDIDKPTPRLKKI
jgi:hypothetical protein